MQSTFDRIPLELIAFSHQNARAQENTMEDLRRRSSDWLWPPQRPSRTRDAANRIRQHRQTFGIPQAALAKRLDVPIWKLSRLERGLDPIPTRLISTVVAMLTGLQPSENSRMRSRRLPVLA
jgi:DNA-binding XRE family transcriptional regulator